MEEEKTQSSSNETAAVGMAMGSPVHSQVKKIIKQESEKKNIDLLPGQTEIRSLVLAREILSRQHSRSRLGLAAQSIVVGDS